MASEHPKFCCRVCGLFQGEDHPPWRHDGKCPSFDICECCGAEFGYDDCVLDDVRRLRKDWLDKGARRVTEYNPSTGSVRTWHECYNSKGKVIRVHPKQINGQEVKSHHYPKIGSEIK